MRFQGVEQNAARLTAVGASAEPQAVASATMVICDHDTASREMPGFGDCWIASEVFNLIASDANLYAAHHSKKSRFQRINRRKL